MNDLETPDLNHPEYGDLYDELPLWSAPFGLMLLDRVDLKPEMTVLDVGAGTGFLSVELAQRCGPKAKIIAVDPSAPVLQRLRRKLDYLGIENVRVVEGKAEEVDLSDTPPDLVVSNLGLNNFECADAVCRHCFRSLRVGGSICITTNLVGHMQEFYDVYRSVLIELGHEERLDTLDAHVHHRATVDSARDLLGSAGFEEIEVSSDSFRLRYASGSAMLRHFFIRLGFLAAWKDVAVPGAVVETLAALEAALNVVSSEKGELSLTIPMACLTGYKR